MGRKIRVLFECLFGLCCLPVLPGVPGSTLLGQEAPSSGFTLWFGPYAGYTSTVMGDVNKILKESEEALRAFGGPSANLANGGLMLGGRVYTEIDRFTLGVDVSYIQVTGSIEFTKSSETVQQKIETTSWIFIGTVGYYVTRRPDYSLEFCLGGGYGWASAEVQSDYVDRLNPNNALIIRASLDGGRFVIVPQGILRIPVGVVQLDFSGGYRFADLGVLKGPGSVNSNDIGETNLHVEGKDARFDLSGFFLTGGLSIAVW